MLYESRFDAERFSVNPSPPSGGIKGGRQLHQGVFVFCPLSKVVFPMGNLHFDAGQFEIGRGTDFFNTLIMAKELGCGEKNA